MSPRLDVSGLEFAYEERGGGPAVLLVHGVAADAASWAPIVGRLADRARVIAYDRRGYGGSQAPEAYRRTTVQEQALDAATLVRVLEAEPVLLCGADFGAMICVELALRSSLSLTGLVLVEPAAFALVSEATEALSGQRAALEQAMRDRGSEAAVDVWLEGWQDGRASDSERVARARRDAAAFFADYGGLTSWPPQRRLLRALSLPVHVIQGPGTPPHVAAASRALAALIPGAVVHNQGDVAGAVHQILGLPR